MPTRFIKICRKLPQVSPVFGMHESDGEIVIDTLQVPPVPEQVLHLQVELEPVGLREWPTH